MIKLTHFFTSYPGGAVFTFPCGSKAAGIGGKGLWWQHASWRHRRGEDDEDAVGGGGVDGEGQGGHDYGDKHHISFYA